MLLAWALGAGWVTTPLLDWAQRDYARTDDPHFAQNTTIVLMGGGTVEDGPQLTPKPDAVPRIAAAATLYRQCRASGATCKVIISGGNPQHHAQAEADNYAPYVIDEGVDPADLTRENKSLDTYQNAQNVARIVGHSHDNGLIVVTSAYHMRRSLAAFHAFGYDPQPYVSDVRHNHVTLLPRFRSLENSELAAHELVGMARFRVWRWLHLY